MPTLYARLKVRDPHRGLFMRDYGAPWGSRFRAGVWYEVDDEAAAYLRTVRARHDDPRSALAFNVCTHDEAVEMVAAEEQAEVGKVVFEVPAGPVVPTRASVRAAKDLNRPKPKHELSAAALAKAAAEPADGLEVLNSPPVPDAPAATSNAPPMSEVDEAVALARSSKARKARRRDR